MRVILRSQCWLIVLLALCSGTGCWPPVTKPSTQGTSRSWDGPGATPGIDRGSISKVTLIDGPSTVSIVVWSDRSGGSSSRGNSNTRGSVFQGSHGNRVNPLDFQTTKATGEAAEFELAGRKFDLTRGTLFLVSTQSAVPVVTQLVGPEIGNVPKDAAEVKRLIAAHPELGEFFKKQQTEAQQP